MCLDFFVTDCEATKEQKSLLEKGENWPSPAWIQRLNIVWLLRHYYNYFGAFACDISSRLLQLYVTQWNKTCFCGVVGVFSLSRLQFHQDFCCQTVVRDLISYISIAAALRPPLFWRSRRRFDGRASAFKSVHCCRRDTLTHMDQWPMLMIAEVVRSVPAACMMKSPWAGAISAAPSVKFRAYGCVHSPRMQWTLKHWCAS